MTEQYIFNADAEKFFYKKLDSLHENYVFHLLMNGMAPKGTDLESIKMTKNPVTSKKYCERVVGGLLNIRPKIVVRLLEDNKIRLECIFTKINDKETINHLFMIQNVMDYPKLDNFNCQIWYLGDTLMEDIKKIWD